MSKEVVVKDMGVLGEVSVLIEYDYQPEEEATRDYPGCAAGVEIGAATAWLFEKGKPVTALDIMPILNARSALMDEFAQAVMDQMFDELQYDFDDVLGHVEDLANG